MPREQGQRPDTGIIRRLRVGVATQVVPFFTQVLLVAGMAASGVPRAPPTIDGLIGPKEWSGARRERLIGGGEVLLLRQGDDLYVAVIGAKRGFPSLCVGDLERVEILHASAALGSVSYTGGGALWRRGKPFEWRVRDAPRPVAALVAERESFLAEHRWLSTASREGAAEREFRITIGPGRHFLGVVFLAIESMKAAYWPASMNDGCRNPDLLRGDPPDALQFNPTRWHRIE